MEGSRKTIILKHAGSRDLFLDILRNKFQQKIRYSPLVMNATARAKWVQKIVLYHSMHNFRLHIGSYGDTFNNVVGMLGTLFLHLFWLGLKRSSLYAGKGSVAVALTVKRIDNVFFLQCVAPSPPPPLLSIFVEQNKLTSVYHIIE